MKGLKLQSRPPDSLSLTLNQLFQLNKLNMQLQAKNNFNLTKQTVPEILLLFKALKLLIPTVRH